LHCCALPFSHRSLHTCCRALHRAKLRPYFFFAFHNNFSRWQPKECKSLRNQRQWQPRLSAPFLLHSSHHFYCILLITFIVFFSSLLLYSLHSFCCILLITVLSAARGTFYFLNATCPLHKSLMRFIHSGCFSRSFCNRQLQYSTSDLSSFPKHRPS
jgi:hypothetical protein